MARDKKNLRTWTESRTETVCWTLYNALTAVKRRAEMNVIRCLSVNNV